jgi:predicted nucleic acid-binding Zn ribbon protein
MQKTYSLKYFCENCGSVEDITMDFGTPAPEIAECPHCGVGAAKKLPIKKPDMTLKSPGKVGDRWL